MMKRTILVSFFVVITAVLLSFIPQKRKKAKSFENDRCGCWSWPDAGWWS